jgi:hypothetical protein
MNKTYAVVGILAVLAVAVFIGGKVASPSLDTSKQGAVAVNTQAKDATNSQKDVLPGTIPTEFPNLPIDGQLYKQCVITSLTAAPAVINAGATSTISWSLYGCKSAKLDGVVVSSPTGSKVTSQLTATKTFTLIAVGGGLNNIATKTITVVVKQPTITVTSPDGGEVYGDGAQVSVQWQSTDLPVGNSTIRVSLDVYSASNALLGNLVLGSGGPFLNDGEEKFMLPTMVYLKGLPGFAGASFGAHFKVRISADKTIAGLPTPIHMEDASNAFFTMEANKFTIVSPNGDEIYAGGQQADIKWTSNLTGAKEVYLSLRMVSPLGAPAVNNSSISLCGTGGSCATPIVNGHVIITIPTLAQLHSYGGSFGTAAAGKNYKIEGVVTNSTGYAYTGITDISDNFFTIN